MTREVYALVNTRSVGFAEKFLQEFLPNRTAFQGEYPVPEAADFPVNVLTPEEQILSFLELHPSEPYGLYWNDKDTNSPAQAMLFYTSDGAVIAGLAVEEPKADAYLSTLMGFTHSKFGMFGDEQRPPETSSEFISECLRFGRRGCSATAT